jgi:hypothetical protein
VDDKRRYHSEYLQLRFKLIAIGDSQPKDMVGTVVAQKSRPSLCRLGIPGSLSHPAQDGSFRNIETQHFQLAVDSRPSPRPVLGYHAEDELTKFPNYAPSSCMLAMPGEPSPVKHEASAMPANNSLGLNENQGSLPSRPDTQQGNPDESINAGKPWGRVTSRQNRQLLAQC